MKVSIIVPCFNVSSYIQKTIESFSNQRFSDFEVIFVNDCSTDNTKETLNQYINQYQINARVIDNDENSGPSLSRLHGINSSEARYIAFCDGDDWYDPDYLQMLVNCIEQQNHDIVFCNYHLAYDSGKIKKRTVLNNNDIFGKEKKELLTINIDGLWCGVYKRSLFSDISFPNLRNGEDMAIIPALIDRASSIGVVEECLYYYYQHKGSLSTTSTYRIVNDLLLSYEYICKSVKRDDNICEIEYLGIRNVLYGAVLCLGKIKNSKKDIKRVIHDFTSEYPDWNGNQYIPQMPSYKRLYLFFVKKENYLALRLLSKIHAFLTSN